MKMTEKLFLLLELMRHRCEIIRKEEVTTQTCGDIAIDLKRILPIK